MPIFKIIDTFKIADRGYVLSRYVVNDGVCLTGDNCILTIGNDLFIFKIAGIHVQKEPKHFGLLVSLTDFDMISGFDLKNKEIKIINVSERKPLAQEPIKWTGDLEDDCTAMWAGLMLRAECMDQDVWWWAVYDFQNNEITIDSSNNYEERFIGGHASRKKAEEIAKKYLNVT